MKNKPTIEYSIDGPLSQLIIAINCYLTTADEIGVAQMLQMPGGKTAITLLYNPDDPADALDYHKLRLRLGEVEAETGIACEWDYQGRHGPFEVVLMILPTAPAAIETLTDRLFLTPSADGYGRGQAYILDWLKGNTPAIMVPASEYVGKLQNIVEQTEARLAAICQTLGVERPDLNTVPRQKIKHLLTPNIKIPSKALFHTTPDGRVIMDDTEGEAVIIGRLETQ